MRNLFRLRFKEIYANAVLRTKFLKSRQLFKDFIRKQRLRHINDIRNFFGDYDYFLRNVLYNDKSENPELDAKHILQTAYNNQILRIKHLHTYFKFIKLANRFATKDYFRDSVNYINPYKSKNFYFNSSFYGQLIGIEPIKVFEDNQDHVYDPYFYHKDPKLKRHSILDDRLAIYKPESEFIYPVYDKEKRFNRNIRNWDLMDEQSVETTFGWYEYWLIEVDKITWWDILIDIIFVKDIIEDAVTYGGWQYESTLPYKFMEFDYHFEHRFYVFNPKSLTGDVKPVNTKVFDGDPARIPGVLHYIKDADEQYSGFVNDEYAAERIQVEDFVDELPRYSKYIRKIWGGMERAPVKTNRYNFKRSNYYNAFWTRNWIRRLKSPKTFLKQKRKPYYGRSTDTEYRYFKSQARRKYKKYGTSHLSKRLKWQGMFNLSIMSRVRTLYPSRRNLKGYYGYPYNQEFIKKRAVEDSEVAEFVETQFGFFRQKQYRKVSKRFAGKPLNFITRQNYKVFENALDFSNVYKKKTNRRYLPIGYTYRNTVDEAREKREAVIKAARALREEKLYQGLQLSKTNTPEEFWEPQETELNDDVQGQLIVNGEYFDEFLTDPRFEIDYYGYLSNIAITLDANERPENQWFWMPEYTRETIPFGWLSDETRAEDNAENRSRPDPHMGKVDIILTRSDLREDLLEIRKYGRLLTDDDDIKVHKDYLLAIEQEKNRRVQLKEKVEKGKKKRAKELLALEAEEEEVEEASSANNRKNKTLSQRNSRNLFKKYENRNKS